MKPWTEETRWQPLGAVVQRLKRRVEAAIEARDEFEGQAAHDQLVAAEWRLRQSERLNEKTRQRANAPGDDRQQSKGNGDE